MAEKLKVGGLSRSTLELYEVGTKLEVTAIDFHALNGYLELEIIAMAGRMTLERAELGKAFLAGAESAGIPDDTEEDVRVDFESWLEGLK